MSYSGGTQAGPKLDLNYITREFFNVQKLSAILDQVGQVVEEDAKANAPVLTGELRDSGSHTTTGLKTVIRFTAEHAAPVEFGHVTASGSFVAARPYLEPAMQKGLTLLPTLITKHAQAVLDRAGT